MKYCQTNDLDPQVLSELSPEADPAHFSRVKKAYRIWKTEDYAVRKEWVAKIVAHFGEEVPQCDAFANATNHHFPIWWGCGGVVPDAFPQVWGRIYLWINPPFSQIVHVIDKLV